jgi:hypothetical protein
MTSCLFYAINESGREDEKISKRCITGGLVKRLIFITAILVPFIIVCASSVQAQTQEIGGYTVIRGGTGSIICLGRWVPSKEAGRPGVCEGQLADAAQLTAISTRQTADKLDQLLTFLASIDQKLADNYVQVERLIEATVNTQSAINQQVEQIGELMHDTISSRVDALSKRVLANETFKKELEKLKQDILADMKKYYPAQESTK